MRRRLLFAALCAAAVGCGGAAAQPPASAPPDPVSGNLNVFAAASLTDAFKEAAGGFQKRHPRAALQLSFAGSQVLATQINQGAPADVFASADQANMQKLVDAGNAAGSPRIFATNRLQIVVTAGNPRGVRSLADLSAAGTVVVLCAPSVPCGGYTAQALSKAATRVTPRSQEQDVKAVLTKVALGEADAGIVYVTDVRSGGLRVQGIDIPDDQNVLASYPVSRVKGGANPAAADAFIDYLVSSEGQAILAGYGFSKPA